MCVVLLQLSWMLLTSKLTTLGLLGVILTLNLALGAEMPGALSVKANMHFLTKIGRD